MIFGGTGSQSEYYDQPDFLSDKFESGTLNLPGVVSLYEGVSFVEKNFEEIMKNKKSLLNILINNINRMDNVKILSSNALDNNVEVISIFYSKILVDVINNRLVQNDIYVRSGLHCAPLAHKTLGSFPQGTVRISFGFNNTINDIEKLLEVLNQLDHQ